MPSAADKTASFVPGAHDALLVVDVQNDFLPGGALGISGGDEVIAPLNDAIRAFQGAGRPIFLTRDWHPPDHCSFAERGGPWPRHCIAGTPGAAFASGLRRPPSATVLGKATKRDVEAYSAFAGTGLAERLAAAGVKRIVIGGLATDYCVLQTVLDARAAGLDAVVLVDAVRAVDVEPGDGARALARMAQAGARLAPSPA